MTQNNKYKVIAVVVIIAGLYFVNKWLHNLPKPVNPDLPPETKSNAISDRNKMLSLGSRGLEVGILQNKLGGLVIDGVFGEKTKAKLLNVKGVSEISLNQFDKK